MPSSGTLYPAPVVGGPALEPSTTLVPRPGLYPSAGEQPQLVAVAGAVGTLTAVTSNTGTLSPVP